MHTGHRYFYLDKGEINNVMKHLDNVFMCVFIKDRQIITEIISW